MDYHVIPDTHILTRGLLNPFSKEYEALSIANQHGALYISKEIVDECCRILANKDLLNSTHYTVNFLSNLKSIKYTEISPNCRVSNKINKSDHHIVAGAIENDSLIILTNDIDLIQQCLSINVKVTQSWFFILNHRLNYNLVNNKIQKDLFIFTPLNNREFSIFIRFTPGDWYNKEIDEIFTICEYEKFLKVFYKTKTKKFHVCLHDEKEFTLKTYIKKQDEIIFYLSITTQNNITHIITKSYHDNDYKNNSNQINKHYVFPKSNISIGHEINNSNHIFSWISGAHTGGYRIDPNKFKILVSNPGLLPYFVNDTL